MLDNSPIQKFQSSFSGGMNLLDDDASLQMNEYREAFNVTNRFGALSPFKEATEIATTIKGKKQGLYVVGNSLILFCEGKAFYMQSGSQAFQQIPEFSMSASADRLHVSIVPASTVNFERVLSSTEGNSNLGVSFNTTKVSQTPGCLVVQDGLTQPWIIYTEGNIVKSRVTQNYEQWNNVASSGVREYVPIGNEMMFHDGILFVVSKDRKKIYRSVTNRPLDFMVNVNNEGKKASTESEGGVDTTSYAVDYSEITAMIPTGKETFLVSTKAPASYEVFINRDSTIFGEPRFQKTQTLFPTNGLNNNCFVDILGDLALIDSTGIRSFNAAKQSNVASNNDIFNLKIASSFVDVNSGKPLVQDTLKCAAINFDAYALFSVNTRHGNVIAVFDTFTRSWSSFIKSEVIGKNVGIKQFAHFLPLSYQIFVITSDNKVYELFAGKEFLTGVCNTRRWTTDNPNAEQKISKLKAIVLNTQKNGTISASGYVDDSFACKTTKSLIIKEVTKDPKPSFDMVSEVSSKSDNQVFLFSVRPLVGWKVGYLITWTGGGKLSNICHLSETVTLNQSLSTAAKIK